MSRSIGNNPMMRYAVKGQTVTEYGFVGILILIACIGVLILLGGNLNALLQGLKADMGRSIDSAAVISALDKGDEASVSETMPEKICFEGGKCVDTALIKTIYDKVQTSGGNGGELTTDRASQLTILGASMDENPAVDDNIADLVTQLGMDGYALGAVESRIDCQGAKCFVRLQRKEAALEAIQTTLTPKFMDTFYQLMAAIEANPTGLPPEDAEAISKYATEIQEIALLYNPDLVTDTKVGAIKKIESPNLSDTTIDDAGDICDSGGDCGEFQKRVEKSSGRTIKLNRPSSIKDKKASTDSGDITDERKYFRNSTRHGNMGNRHSTCYPSCGT